MLELESALVPELVKQALMKSLAQPLVLRLELERRLVLLPELQACFVGRAMLRL